MFMQEQNTKIMHQTEPTLQPLNPDVEPDQERIAEVSEHVAEALGHTALASEYIDDAYVTAGINQIEAHLAEKAAAPTARKGNREHDIEAAHEAANLENQIFDAHAEALEENKLFDAYSEALLEDAHFEALKEDKEREASKSPELTTKDNKDKKQAEKAETATDTDDPTAEGSTEARAQQESSTTQNARTEASKALEQAGLNTAMAVTGEVTKDTLGNITVLRGTDATVIAPAAGGKPKITEYHYDQKNGKLTIGTQQFDVIHGPRAYEQTQLKPWQTYDNVENLPPHIAKRFGIERLVLVK